LNQKISPSKKPCNTTFGSSGISSDTGSSSSESNIEGNKKVKTNRTLSSKSVYAQYLQNQRLNAFKEKNGGKMDFGNINLLLNSVFGKEGGLFIFVYVLELIFDI